MNYIENFENAIRLLEKGKLLDSLHIFESLIRDGYASKIPDLYFGKGKALLGLGRLDDAIVAFLKIVSDDNLSLWIKRNYCLGECYMLQKKYEEALSYFEKCGGGLELEISFLADFNTCVCLQELGFFRKAIDKYDFILRTYIGFDKSVSLSNKGICYMKLGDYEKALTLFRGLLIEPNWIHSAYTYFCIGNCYRELGKFEESVEYYRDAESHSIDNKFPDASFNLGLSLEKLNRLEDAVLSYEKSEIDSLNQINPDASHNKGACLIDLYRLDEAIIACKKTINDSLNNRHSGASYNLGVIYGLLNDLDEAIFWLSKAINDTDRRVFPDASFLKGKFLYWGGNIEDSISAFKKTIDDSEEKYYPKAYLYLSKIYFKIDKEKSKKYAFQAINQDSNDLQTVINIKENFISERTKKFYEAKEQYLLLKFFPNDFKTKILFDEGKTIFDLIKGIQLKVKDEDRIISALLINDINFPFNIDEISRKRLAYLIAMIENKPWYCYYIIETFIKNVEEVRSIDAFFYLYSGYLVGEKISLLKQDYFLNLDKDNFFYDLYQKMNFNFEQAELNNFVLDDFLLDVKAPNFEPFNSAQIKSYFSNELEFEAFLAFLNNREFDFPISRVHLEGIIGQYYFSKINTSSKDYNLEGEKLAEWKNLINSLNQSKIDFEHVFEVIQKVIIVGIPIDHTINYLSKIFNKTENIEEKQNIAVLHACAWMTYVTVTKKRSIYHRSEVDYTVQYFTELGIVSSMPFLLSLNIVGDFGVTLVIAKISKSVLDYLRLKSNEKKNRNYFDVLKTELI